MSPDTAADGQHLGHEAQRELRLEEGVWPGPKAVQRHPLHLDASTRQALRCVSGHVRQQDHRLMTALAKRLRQAKRLVVRSAEDRMMDDEEDAARRALPILADHDLHPRCAPLGGPSRPPP